MFIKYNRNPAGYNVGDCVIRAIATILDFRWERVHDELCDLSADMYDMPSSNRVWKAYLELYGLHEHVVETYCPNCLTVQNFCKRHKYGRYLLSTCEYTAANQIMVVGSHVVAVIDGDYYDTWDSGDDIPLSYFCYE